MTSGLRTHCDCGILARILPATSISDPPALLVCGRFPRSECEFRQYVPEDAAQTIGRPVSVAAPVDHRLAGGHGPIETESGWVDADAWCSCGAPWGDGACLDQPG